MWGGWGGMGTGTLFFWLIACAGVFFFFRSCGWPRRRIRRSPLEIVGERYARGEISRDEYEEIKRSLGHG
jgi:putative membrane protein